MCSNCPGTKYWNQPLGHKWTKLNICNHLLASSTHLKKQVTSRRRKNEVFKMSKDQKCTWKACKNTVFHCQICKFMGFLLPSSSWLLKLPYSMLITLYKIIEVHFRLLGTHGFQDREWKIFCYELALSSEPQIWKFHVVVWQTTSKHRSKKASRTCSTIVFLHSTNQIIDLWPCRWCCRRQILNSLFKSSRLAMKRITTKWTNPNSYLVTPSACELHGKRELNVHELHVK